MEVKITRLRRGRGVHLPRYMSAEAAGMDVFAAIDSEVTVSPRQRILVPTGIAMAMPAGYEAQVRPRSGLAKRVGLTILNAPGTIDPDYRGEIKVLLINLGEEPVVVHPGDRVAQMIVAPVERVAWEEVDELPPSDRDDGGFGHTDARGVDGEQ